MKIYLFIFSCLLIGSCQRAWHVAEVDPDSYRFDKYNSVEPDSILTAFVQPFKQQLDKEMNQVIGEVGTKLTKQRPESTLGNFVADLLVSQAEKCSSVDIDFAVQNYGGIRVPEVGIGPFPKFKAFDIMPFENMITIIQSDGRIVRQLFERIVETGIWPVSNSIQLTVTGEQLIDVTIDGQPLEDSNTYIYALPDYIANGGDQCAFLIDQQRLPCNISVRDAIIQHIEELTLNGEKISATLSNRIISK